nr:hypothetical protein A5881_000753 [Enterococcus termitis]
MYDQLQSIEDRYEELGELLSDPEAVSYTHLDVYKRQEKIF